MHDWPRQQTAGTARVVDSLTVGLMMSDFSHIYFSTVCLQIIVLVEFRYDEYMWVLLPETGVSDRDNCLFMPETRPSGDFPQYDKGHHLIKWLVHACSISYQLYIGYRYYLYMHYLYLYIISIYIIYIFIHSSLYSGVWARNFFIM